MRHRGWLIIAVPLLLMLLAAISLLWLNSQRPGSSPSDRQPTPSITATTVIPTAPALSAQDVTRLESALNSPSRQMQATALIPDVASSYPRLKKSLVTPGTTIKILLSTTICKVQTCSVDAIATRPNRTVTKYVFYLDHASGQWLIFRSSQLKEG